MKIDPNLPEDIAYIEKVLDTSMKGANVIGYHSDNGMGLIGLRNYCRNEDIEIEAVGEGSWLNKYLLRHLFTHIFTMLNCIRCTAIIKNDNKKSIELVTRLGFVKEGELRGVNRSIYSLLRSDCKWAKQKKK